MPFPLFDDWHPPGDGWDLAIQCAFGFFSVYQAELAAAAGNVDPTAKMNHNRTLRKRA